MGLKMNVIAVGGHIRPVVGRCGEPVQTTRLAIVRAGGFSIEWMMSVSVRMATTGILPMIVVRSKTPEGKRGAVI